MKTQSNDTDEMSRALLKLTEELENTRAQLCCEIDRRKRAHGGDIEVQNNKDKGSLFRVTLPTVENSA